MAATYMETAHRISPPPSLAQENWREKAGEYFWFTVCFVLFLILGPFAAPIALGFVLSNHANNSEMVEPERIVNE
jgi:hypothetical protein